MIKQIKTILAGLLAVPVLAFGVGLLTPFTPVANAAECDSATLTAASGVNCSHGTGTPTELFGPTSIFTTIVNILLFVIGAVSVIMLIIGGIRYTVSGGTSAEVTNAKNTIMYAIIGLVVAFLAYAIVNWVLGRLVTG